MVCVCHTDTYTSSMVRHVQDLLDTSRHTRLANGGPLASVRSQPQPIRTVTIGETLTFPDFLRVEPALL